MPLLAAGDRLGPYEILAPIGAGGMGEVYKARDTRLNRIVAIKVSKDQFSERFEQEARAVAALNHPNICQLYDVGPNYLVMEFVEGSPLKGPLPIEKTVEYASQILDALDAAHQKGITHRDLKPDNILVTKQGIKLLDFGLAKQNSTLKEADATITQALTNQGQILGTWQYMSPEQLQGKPVDARSDLFSFGCVLYEALTGKRAFEGESAASVIAAILEREPAPLPTPTPLDRVIKRCLAKDPDLRFQTARDLRAALTWAMEQPPASAATPAKRSNLAWAVAGAAVLVSAVLALGWWRETRPLDRPLMRFNVDLGPDAVAGARVTAAISPDGMRLAFVARGPTGKEQLATRRLDQENATLLAGTENAIDPFFSPDGQWIGFFADHKMKKVSVLGGAAVTLCETGEERGASWGEDGNIIFTPQQARTGLWRVPEAGGVPQALTTPAKGEYSHRWPQILPGGQAVLFTSVAVAGDWENGFIEVLTLKTGQWKMLVRGGYSGRYLPTSSGTGHLVYIHEGTLFGVGFDPNRNEVKGTPVPLLENVAVSTNTGRGDFEFSGNGVLVFPNDVSHIVPMVLLDDSQKTQPLLLPAKYDSARFSPDGKRLVLQTNTTSGDLYVFDREHERTTRLTSSGLSNNPTWSLDGKHIVFRAGSTLLQWIRADGAGAPQTLLEGKDQVTPNSFSPDGKNLAFTQTTPDTSQDIWILPLDTTDPERPRPGKPQLFVQTPQSDSAPAFSPDGKWIAYGSAESGRFEVYVRPFPAPVDGSASPKYQISVNGGNRPAWSRTAPELFFTAPDNRIMVARFKAGPQSFDAEKPRVWSDTQVVAQNPPLGWTFDLAPDGRHVVALVNQTQGGEKASIHVNVLLNFFDELRRRVPVAGK